MTEEEVASRQSQLESRAKSNTHRLDRLELLTDAVGKLTCSVEVMMDRQNRLTETIDKMDGKVSALEQRSGKRWDSVVEKMIVAAAGAVAAWAMLQLGL